MAKQSTETHLHKRQLHLVRHIKRKLQDQDVMIAEADKGKTTVILHKPMLEDKVNQFIQDNHIEILKKDNTKNAQTNTKCCKLS
jgi:hypothetical protein